MPILNERNTILGFAGRARKNLEFIKSALEQGDDVHIVTQLVTSMLGLFMFPQEWLKSLPPGAGARGAFEQELKKAESQGWPEWSKWTFHLGGPSSAKDFLRQLRNAIAHRQICFSSDSRVLAEVDVEFWSRPPPRQGAPDPAINWHVSINGADLYGFVLQYAEVLTRVVG